MTKDEAYDLLVDHNCAGPCPCEECAEAKKVLKEPDASSQEVLKV